MTTTDQFALYRTELRVPGSIDRDPNDGDISKLISGYWRIEGAKTKPDYPVAIMLSEDGEATIFQIGRKRPMNSVENDTEWHEFLTGSWLKCIAVTKADWASALDQGRWPDGKPSRQLTDEEKLDLIPDTPASEGGNAPVDDAAEHLSTALGLLDAPDPFHEQIKTKIESLMEKAGKIGKIDTLDKANAAAAIVEPLRGLGRQGEAKRKAEKGPWDEGAAKVQAKWATTLLQPASQTIALLVDGIDKFQKSERLRLQREEDERQRVERDRLRREEEDRLAAEAAVAAEEAAKRGEEATVPDADEIAAQAEAAAEERMAEAPPPEPVAAPRVGTTYGRAISKPKTRKGRIVDREKFVAALKGQEDFEEWLADKANKLARAKVALDGMEIYEE